MKKTNQHLSGHLRRLAVAAFLAALSIVCGKYLAIPMGTVMRFSFENLPIILAGMLFGPAIGATTAVVADLLGCVMVGYAINPVVTLGAACIGLVSGIVYRMLPRLTPFFRIAIPVLSAHIIGSVLIKTWGLAVFYDMPFLVLLLWRLLNYVIVGTAEGLLIYCILKSNAVKRNLEKLRCSPAPP